MLAWHVADSTALDAQVLGRLAVEREELVRAGEELEAQLLREQRAAGTGTQRKTIWQADISPISPLYLPISPLYLPYISLYLPYISPISPYISRPLRHDGEPPGTC